MEEMETAKTMTLLELEKNISTLIPDLATAAKKPAIDNPFVSKMSMTLKDKVVMVLLCFLIPIRMVLLVIMLLLGSLIAKLFLLGYKEENPLMPLTGTRRFGQTIIWIIARCITFLCGFHYIKVKGKLAGAHEAPVVVFAPHSSFMDAFPMGMLGAVSAVSRIENVQAPWIGDCIRMIQPISVTRDKKESKDSVVKEIKRRAKDGNWPPIVISPEGTCTNRQCLITFKPGAFYPGVPVQPVLLTYPDELDYTSWCWKGPGAFQLLCVMMSRLNNNLTIEALPVYKPSEEEKKDPFLYSRNVRQYMAEIGSFAITDHSFEDCRLMNEAKKLGLPPESGIVEYYKLSPMIGMNCDCMIEYLQRYAKIDSSCNGYVDLEEFCNYLNLPPTNEVKTIFRIYDIDKDNRITFREYLLGFFLISTPFNTTENISTAFNLFDTCENGFITYDDFATLLKRVMQLDDVHIQRMYADLDSKKTGKVQKDEFKEFCSRKPEYALLFIHFRKLQSGASSMTYSRTELGDSNNTLSEDILKLSDSIPSVSV